MTRPLRYPLQFPVTIEGDSINESPLFSLDGWSALDSDTEIDIVMRMSLNQYTQIASAFDVGRDIAYPDLSENLWAMFVSRIVSMSLCDSVANCIENSDAVQTSIENFLANNSTSITTINTRIDSLENATMTTVTPDLCDDRRFGGIRAVIDRLDINSIDFLENASDDLRDVFERVDTIIEAIPVYGDIADIMLDFAQSASQDALDEYTAQSTQALKDAIACDIFCNTSGCEITIDDVIDAYKSLLPPTFDTAILETLADIVTWFISGNVQSDTWFALVNLSQLFVIKLVKEFFGFTLPVFKIEFARGSNNPDNTHTLLCPCASACNLIYDFTLSDNGFIKDPYGQYLPSVGWGTQYAVGDNRVYIKKQFTACDVSTVAITFTGNTGNASRRITVILFDGSTNVGQLTQVFPALPDSQVLTFAFNNISADSIRIVSLNASGLNESPTAIVIETVEING